MQQTPHCASFPAVLIVDPGYALPGRLRAARTTHQWIATVLFKGAASMFLLLLCFGGEIVAQRPPSVAEAKGTPCVGVLHSRDVYLLCPGNELPTRLTDIRNVVQWALSDNGDDLIVAEKRADALIDITVFDVQTSKIARAFTGLTSVRVHSTCGTVLVSYDEHNHRRYVDALTGAVKTSSGEEEIRCSAFSDQTVRGRAAALNRMELYAGRQSRPFVSDVAAFDVSPSGRYVAILAGTRLCVRQGYNGQQLCTEAITALPELAVSESGAVLFSQSAGWCWGSGADWPCTTVYQWSPTTGILELVAADAKSAVFVQRATADRFNKGFVPIKSVQHPRYSP